MTTPSPTDDSSRFAHGLPSNHTPKDAEDFAQFRIGVYGTRPWTGSLLSMYFGEDFSSFTLDTFGLLRQDTRRNLRDVLREKGVYVERRRGVLTKDALFAAAQDELPWPPDESVPADKGDASNSEGTGNRRLGSTSGDGNDKNTPRHAPIISKDPNFSYAVMSVLKAYNHDAYKYSGSLDDTFETKFTLFNERCDQADIPHEKRHLAFSAMLSGAALNFYLSHVKNSCTTLPEMTSKMRERFITQESVLALTREWESVTLLEYQDKYPNKMLSEVFGILVARLQELQLCLPRSFHSDDLLKNRLLNACTGVEACRLARQKVAPTVMGVIADLQTSISTFNWSALIQNPSANALLTDRRRITQRGGAPWQGRRNNRGKAKCIVCNKIGCWSTNHTFEERKRALRENNRLRAFVMDVLSLTTSPDNDTETPEEQNEYDILEEIAANLVESPEDKHDTHYSTAAQTEPGASAYCTLTSSDRLRHFVCDLNEASTLHTLTHSVSPPVRPRYSACTFMGVAIDTCCAHASTCGLEQYKAYCAHVGRVEYIQRQHKERVQFGIGNTMALGTDTCHFLVNNLLLSVKVYIVDADVPFLLSLADMDRLSLSYDNTEDILHHRASGFTAEVSRKHGHPFVTWSRTLRCLFTITELHRLHRRFGHPAAEKLHNLLRRARPNDVSPGTLRELQKIARMCNLCQFETAGPRRFKFTLREDKDFNHSIYVDIMSLDKAPVLHIVDESTRYQAARWLQSVSTESIWRAVRLAWIDTYLGLRTSS